MNAPLCLVPTRPRQERPERDIHAYEAEQRQRSAAKRWDMIHIAGDRRAPISLNDRPGWKGWLR
jgi:hypothetical protein